MDPQIARLLSRYAEKVQKEVAKIIRQLQKEGDDFDADDVESMLDYTEVNSKVQPKTADELRAILYAWMKVASKDDLQGAFDSNCSEFYGELQKAVERQEIAEQLSRAT